MSDCAPCRGVAATLRATLLVVRTPSLADYCADDLYDPLEDIASQSIAVAQPTWAVALKPSANMVPKYGVPANSPTISPFGGNTTKAVVGGVCYEAGGWAEYEITRRQARVTPGRYSRSEVSGADVVELAFGGGGRTTPLQRAAGRLSEVLGRYEDQPFDTEATLPAITAAELRDIATSPPTDPADLRELAADVTAAVSAATGRVLAPVDDVAIPALSDRIVSAADEGALLELEASVIPHVEGLESLQAAVATRLDEASGALEAGAPNGVKTTRGGCS